MKRVKRFGVYQTAKVASVIYFLMVAVFMVPFGLFSSFFGDNLPSGFPFGGGIFFILMPFIYGIMAFIMTAIGCLVYNLIAQWTGGIEIEIETADEGSDYLE